MPYSYSKGKNDLDTIFTAILYMNFRNLFVQANEKCHQIVQPFLFSLFRNTCNFTLLNWTEHSNNRTQYLGITERYFAYTHKHMCIIVASVGMWMNQMFMLTFIRHNLFSLQWVHLIQTFRFSRSLSYLCRNENGRAMCVFMKLAFAKLKYLSFPINVSILCLYVCHLPPTRCVCNPFQWMNLSLFYFELNNMQHNGEREIYLYKCSNDFRFHMYVHVHYNFCMAAKWHEKQHNNDTQQLPAFIYIYAAYKIQSVLKICYHYLCVYSQRHCHFY